MSLNPNHHHLEASSYRIQPSSQYAFFDGHIMSQEALESTSDSAPTPRARRGVPSPRDRCRSFLLIFTLYLLFSICLATGLSYIDSNQVYFMRWPSFPNIDSSHGVPAPSTWEGLKGGEHCLRYATREYTARLSTNTIGQEAMRACKETPTEIHGRILQTNFCQDLGIGRGVWGFWIVDFDEPACQTKWDKFVDLGCEDNNPDTEMSLRRIEAHLENLQTGADWRIMCTTTPADIRGRHFFTPAECFNMGKLGVFGAWDVQDASC